MLHPRARKLLKVVLAVTAGAALGVGLWFVVGCPTGGCIITSSPQAAGLYGAAIGGLVGMS